ncbi:MAG: dihydroorotase [Candidatus Sedimenticola sp. (ex Thyasira tokunagai)]
MSRVQITNGRLIDPANGIDGEFDLYIEDGIISAVGTAPEGFSPDWVIDAADQIICPGLVDLRTHLREPGEEHKATIAGETRAAARSGITTLCCTPDTHPVIDTPAVVALIRRRAKQAGNARVLSVGALTQALGGKQLSEMAALQQAGCIGLSNADIPLANTLVERRALEYAATFGIITLLRPEDQDLKDGGCTHEGPVGTRLGLPPIPEAAETVAVARDLALATQTGSKIHFQTLSCGSAAQMIEQAQQQRIPVTCDIAAHQLHLTEMDIEGFDSNCHLSPPLRSLTDRNTLRDAVARGVIGAICSDHQPHEADAKAAPFPATATGLSALDTLLPLTLKLVHERVLSLTEAIARVTCGPADILGLPYGRLDPGRTADICIFDPEKNWILTEETMASNGTNTPFLGWEFTGRVTHTLFEGKIVYKRDNN